MEASGNYTYTHRIYVYIIYAGENTFDREFGADVYAGANEIIQSIDSRRPTLF